MVVDRHFVERLLREMDAHVAILHDAAELPREELLNDPLRVFGVLYALQCCIEGVMSVGHHLVAECNLPTPEGNRELAGVLGASRVIADAGLVERLPRIIRFRNLLVHRYWKVEPAIVMDIVDHHLGDFALFAGEVIRWLGARPEV